MDDAFLMRRLERFGDLEGDALRLGDRQSFPSEAALEGLAANIL